MFMGAELSRKRAGKKTKTKMSAKQLEEYASTPRGGLPKRAKKKRVGAGQAAPTSPADAMMRRRQAAVGAPPLGSGRRFTAPPGESPAVLGVKSVPPGRRVGRNPEPGTPRRVGRYVPPAAVGAGEHKPGYKSKKGMSY